MLKPYLKALGATHVVDRNVSPSKESFAKFSEEVPIKFVVLDAISSKET